jgi:3-methyladenine DNA glycosylase AlkD
MNQVVKQIREELILKSDAKTKESSQRFFKEKVKTHGVKSKEVGIIVKKTLKTLSEYSKQQVFSIVEELYQSGYCEESWIGSALALDKKEEFVKTDFKIFEKWIDSYIDDWAKCDVFCNHTVWALLNKYPELIPNLKKWAISKNRWMRRASSVSLINPAKEGKYLEESLQLADILLTDKEDLVQKGYGWLLKEQSRKHQKTIFEYVVKHKKEMPRTALRYAIELMPGEIRKKAMEK